MCYDRGLIGKGICPSRQRLLAQFQLGVYFIHFISLSNLVTTKVVYWTHKVVI